MKAQQVVRTETGDEVRISAGFWFRTEPGPNRAWSNKSYVVLQVLIPFAEDGSVEAEQNTDLPDYLPEDESPAQEPDKAVSRVGSGQDGTGWLGAAANFLSRSFYW